MRSRVVRPERTRIPISDGDWIEVKAELNAGEYRRSLARLRKVAEDGSVSIDPYMLGLHTMLAYLLDWSLVDLDGRVIHIRDEGPEVVEHALAAIDIESYEEIRLAILAHERRIYERREEQKKTHTSANASSPISESLAGAGGGTSG